MGIFLFGAVLCFGKKSEGRGCRALRWVPHASAGRSSCLSHCQRAALPLSIPPHTVGAGGRRGEARQFVVMLHFLLQNSVFTTIGLACPRSSGLRSRLCCFISVSSGSFLFAPAGRLLFHVFPPLPHAVPARQPATCSKASFPLLCPAPPQPPAPLAVQTLIRCFGHRCLGPAPVFDRSALCDKRVDTWTVASPSITTLSLALFTFVTVSPFDSHICNVDLGGWPSGFLPPPLAVAWYPPPHCSSNRFEQVGFWPPPMAGLTTAGGTWLSFLALAFCPPQVRLTISSTRGLSQRCAQRRIQPNQD